MSIEVTLHPEASDKRGLRALLVELGFERCSRLWDWPEGSLHFRWFSDVEYQSYDGVEATIFAPTEALDESSRPCAWALHTRTRASASPADREQQNRVVRAARKRFGGAFHNDSAGKNRYTKIEDDGRDAPSRGIYLAYESVRESVSAVQYALPDPTPDLERLVGTDLEPLSEVDPQRVLYNALVPFTLAAVEHFLSRSFSLGRVTPAYRAVNHHAARRLRQWLCRKHKTRHGKFVRFPDRRLYGEYGLTCLTRQTMGLPSAKA